MKPIVIRIPVEARALQTISSMRSPALFESACPRSTEQTHTVSLQIMSENGILSNVLCRQAQKMPQARARQRHSRVRRAHDAHSLVERPGRIVRPAQSPKKKCARARRASGAALRLAGSGRIGRDTTRIENPQNELRAPGLLHAHSQERALAGRNKPGGLAPTKTYSSTQGAKPIFPRRFSSSGEE